MLELPHSLKDIPVDSHSLSTKPLAEVIEGWNLPSLSNTTYHLEYHPLFEIDAFINHLAVLSPNTTRIHRLGHSGQGRELIAMTISKTAEEPQGQKKKPRKTQNRPSTEEKLGFVIMGAQHAREVRLLHFHPNVNPFFFSSDQWIATATSLYLAHALTANASEPGSLSSLLDVFVGYDCIT